jgi:hypothetical protein
VREVLPSKRAINPPLGLATLAALGPPDREVTIVDENIESLWLSPRRWTSLPLGHAAKLLPVVAIGSAGDETIRPVVAVDSSLLNVVLVPRGS